MRGFLLKLIFLLLILVAAAVALASPQDASLPEAGPPAGEDSGVGPRSDAGPAGDAGDSDRPGADAAPDGETEELLPEEPDEPEQLDDEDDDGNEWLEPTNDLPADQSWIFIDKSERRLVVQDGHGYHETMRVALGPQPIGDKELEGDGRTPEGEFYICHRVRHERFDRFLGLSYPGPEDAHRGQALGLLQPIEIRAILRAFRHRTEPPWRTALGGNVGIHGYGERSDCAARRAAGEDWTDGCIGVTNEEIERIFNHTSLGTRVVIVP